MEQYWIAAGAAILASLLTIAGGWFADRRDHDKWLRNERRTAYQDVVTRVSEMQLFAMVSKMAKDADKDDAESALRAQYFAGGLDPDFASGGTFARMLRALTEAVGAVDVLGPDNVANAATKLQSLAIKVMSDGKHDDVAQASDAFGQAVRAALRSNK